MCHDEQSRPPAPPTAGPVAEHGATTLTSADGTEFAAYAASPERGGGVGVVVLPDVRGLHPYYRTSRSASPRPAWTRWRSTTSTGRPA